MLLCPMYSRMLASFYKKIIRNYFASGYFWLILAKSYTVVSLAASLSYFRILPAPFNVDEGSFFYPYESSKFSVQVVCQIRIHEIN